MRYSTYVGALLLICAFGAGGRFFYAIISDLAGMLGNCGAAGYSGDSYLARCESESYGDYDTKAFLYDLEPAAVRNAKDSTVVFTGNSRIQFTFGTDAVRQHFTNTGIKHYLLGFGDSREAFLQALLQKMAIQPKLLIVQTDSWYFGWLGDAEPFKASQFSGFAPATVRYQQLKQWIHRHLCSSTVFIDRFGACPDKNVLFRNRSSGEWDYTSITWGRPVHQFGFDYAVDNELLERQKPYARKFMDVINVPRNCVVFTSVPWPHQHLGTGRALAEYLGVRFVLPKLSGLKTFDNSHLDAESAERFSEAFMRELAPILQECVAATPANG